MTVLAIVIKKCCHVCNKKINKLHCVVVLPLYVCTYVCTLYLHTGILPSLQWLKCHHIVLLLTKKKFFNQVSSLSKQYEIVKDQQLKKHFCTRRFFEIFAIVQMPTYQQRCLQGWRKHVKDCVRCSPYWHEGGHFPLRPQKLLIIGPQLFFQYWPG